MKMTTNKIEAEINSDKENCIFLSIPYSKYWNAKIDNKNTDIRLSQTAFMEITVPKGTHLIKLTYKNKSFVLGGIISVFSFIIFGVVCLYNKFLSNNKKNCSQDTIKNRACTEKK